MSLIAKDMERPEEIWLNRSSNHLRKRGLRKRGLRKWGLRKRGLRNVARHVPKSMGRDVTPDFLLASNRQTANLKRVLKK